jgi:hypothetical protein
VLLLAGCGGSGGDKATSTALSEAQFNKQATAICQQTREAVQELLREYVKEHPESLHIQPEIARDKLVLEITRSLVEKQAEGLAGLVAPQETEEQVRAIGAAIEAGIKRDEEDPQSTIIGTYREANKLAAEAGLSQCEIAL